MVSPWVVQTLLAIVFLTPAWLAMPYFQSKYGVSGTVFGVWYFFGSALSMALFGVPKHTLVPSIGIVTAILSIGLTIGAMANAMLFTAVAAAPNPGLAVSLVNLTSLTTLFGAMLLAYLLPAHFTADAITARHVVGVVLILLGAALIAVK
jgi:hypothetical protein